MDLGDIDKSDTGGRDCILLLLSGRNITAYNTDTGLLCLTCSKEGVSGVDNSVVVRACFVSYLVGDEALTDACVCEVFCSDRSFSLR